MRQTLEWDRYYPLSPQSIEDKYWTSAGWNWTKSTFPLPGTQRGETLCNRPLAQHCAEEEEDGSSSPDVTCAICLPSWSQTLFSACTSAVSFNSSFSTVFVLGELNELQNTALQLAGSISACQIFTPALCCRLSSDHISDGFYGCWQRWSKTDGLPGWCQIHRISLSQ